MRPYSNEKIAIVGMSAQYPGAKTPLELWENVLSKRVQFRRIPDERLPLSEYYDSDENAKDKTYGNRVAVIDGYEFDWIGKRIPKKTYDATDTVQWLALDITLKMLEDAGIEPSSLPKETTAVILGNTLVGDTSRSKYFRLRWPFVQKTLRTTAECAGMASDDIVKLEESMERVFKSVFPDVNEDTIAGGLANTIAGRVCNYLDLKGGGYIVDGACASSLIAISTAAEQLLLGDLDFAIAGGVDMSLDTFELIGFAKAGALSKTEMRVYDKRGDGFIPGEGCGIIGLKRLSDAKRDGNKIYAVLEGWGVSTDGKSGIATPTVEGQSFALKRAFAKAKLEPSELDFIEGHGTGTKVGDYIELTAMADALNSNKTMKDSSCGVTSFKTIVGHTKAASGIGGLIKTVIALNQRVMPPLANCEKPHGLFSTKAKSLYPIIEGEIRPQDIQMKAGVSSMGFGGINTHVVLSSADKPYAHLKPKIHEEALFESFQDSELFIFSSESQSLLTEKVERLVIQVEQASYAEIADIAVQLSSEVKSHERVKAAVMVQTPFQASERLKILIDSLKNNIIVNTVHYDYNNDIYISTNTDDKHVAFVFPGQGSQQINAAKKLIRRYPWAQKIVDKAKEIFKKYDCEDILELLFRPLDKVSTDEEVANYKYLLRQTEKAQPAIVLSSIIWYEYMLRAGIVPKSVSGHSLGELTAFYAAGCFTLKEVIELAVLRGKLMASSTENAGSMVSLMCEEDAALSLIGEVSTGYLSIANLNSSRQTVVSGDKDAVARLIDIAIKNNINAIELPVSNAFHSKIVAEAAKNMKKHFPVSSKIKQLNKIVVSSTDGKIIDETLDLREHFSEQIVKKVDFITTAKTLDSLSDIVIEIGPAAILSKLLKSNIDNINAYPIASTADTFKDVNRVFAILFTNNFDINWNSIYENRLIRPFVPAEELKFVANPCEYPFSEDSLKKIEFLNIPEGRGIDIFTDIPSDQLTDYMKKRKTFISDVIKSDMKSLSEFESKAMVCTAITDVVLPETKVTNHRVESISTLDTLLNIASEMTGFPRESLNGSMHLLDDLNFDSIKAGELVTSAAEALNITKEVDPVMLAGAPIEGIAKYFDTLLSETLPSDIIDTVSDGISENRWVRDFVMQSTQDNIDLQTVKPNKENLIKIFDRSVGILYKEKDIDLAKEISKLFSDYGIECVLSNYNSPDNDTEHLIVLLPKPNNSDKINNDSIQSALELLQTPLTSNIKSITYVQYNSVLFNHSLGESKIESSCAASYAASVHLERPHLRVRVIDFDFRVDKKIIAEAVLYENLLSSKYLLTSYDKNGLRFIKTAVKLETQLEPKREYVVSQDDIILVTGGAKGITAECALALGEKSGATMVLVGSSPYPEKQDEYNEIIQTLKKFKKQNIHHKYVSCDIADYESVEKLVKKIEGEFGEITCIIHGAGINNQSRAGQLDVNKAYQEVAPKVTGMMNLCNVLDKKPPKLIVGLSSIIGITGMPGNSLYAFSNEVLNHILRDFEKDHIQTNVISIAYSVWADVGMGAKMGSTKYLEQMGILAIPVDQGVEHFLRLIEYKPKERLVAVSSQLDGLDTWYKISPAKSKASRFLENILSYEADIEIVAQAHITLEDDNYIRDHKYRRTYLFPTVFGLEAMAQAAACVLRQDSLKGVVFEDISLDKPIIIDPVNGTDIYIKALVHERTAENILKKVFVSISTDKDGFDTPAFSAILFIDSNHSNTPIEEKFGTPSKDLGIEPLKELYSYQLFQGNMFQRIEKVYTMNSMNTLCEAKYSESVQAFSKKFPQELILGDPCFRDAMLQSPQLMEEASCLPVGISKLIIYPRDNDELYYIDSKVVVRNEKEMQCAVQAMNGDGHVIEEISGYYLKKINNGMLFQKPEIFANPAENDQKLFTEKLQQIENEFNIKSAAVILQYDQTIDLCSKKQRHEKEKPIFSKVLSMLNGEEKYIDMIEWNDEGKPLVSEDDLHISLSHNQAHILCTAGYEPQGCDMEVVEERSEVFWSTLSDSYKDILPLIMEHDQNIHQAGTRLWTLIESYVKAYGTKPEKISINIVKDDIILFNVSCGEQSMDFVTFSITFTRNRKKIIAFPIEYTETMAILNEDIKEVTKTKTDNSEAHNIRIGPNGELQQCYRFRVSFKEATMLQKLVNYSTFAFWMGKAREAALLSIGDELIASSSSGDYAWVTNYSNIQILGDVTSFDLIEGRTWTSKRFGNKNSSNVLHFDWIKIKENGTEERVAYCEMGTTWVHIKDHGVVESEKYPDYLESFMSDIEPKNASSGSNENFHRETMPETLYDLKLSGEILYKTKEGPVVEPLLHTEVIPTTLEHSNLIGNIYFAHYYEWQKTVIDRYLYHIIPEYYRGIGEEGELFAISSAVNHLREAMPFNTIKITMHLKTLYENGVELYFNYYALSSDDKWFKLAYGIYQGVWLIKKNNKYIQTTLPEKIIKAFEKKFRKCAEEKSSKIALTRGRSEFGVTR